MTGSGTNIFNVTTEIFFYATSEIFSNVTIEIFLNRAYNHTTRVCRRPLVEECLPSYDGGYSAPGAAAEPELVCETFYETECRTVRLKLLLVSKIFLILRIWTRGPML